MKLVEWPVVDNCPALKHQNKLNKLHVHVTHPSKKGRKFSEKNVRRKSVSTKTHPHIHHTSTTQSTTQIRTVSWFYKWGNNTAPALAHPRPPGRRNRTVATTSVACFQTTRAAPLRSNNHQTSCPPPPTLSHFPRRPSLGCPNAPLAETNHECTPRSEVGLPATPSCRRRPRHCWRTTHGLGSLTGQWRSMFSERTVA